MMRVQFNKIIVTNNVVWMILKWYNYVTQLFRLFIAVAEFAVAHLRMTLVASMTNTST